VIINIQQEKHKLMQGRHGIEGTGRWPSQCPSTVKLALFLSISTRGVAYMWKRRESINLSKMKLPGLS